MNEYLGFGITTQENIFYHLTFSFMAKKQIFL